MNIYHNTFNALSNVISLRLRLRLQRLQALQLYKHISTSLPLRFGLIHTTQADPFTYFLQKFSATQIDTMQTLNVQSGGPIPCYRELL